MTNPSTVSPTLRIGELSRRAGRSIHTIRWYESVGLVPGVLRDAAGRRVYRTEHVDWLGLIDRLRQTGMSIAEVRDYAVLVRQGRGSLAARRTLLAAHHERVIGTIAEWRRSLRLIEAKIDFYDRWIDTGRRPPLPAAEPKAPARSRSRSAATKRPSSTKD